MTYQSRCFHVYHVCVTYVQRIGPATYVLRIFKCTHKKRSTSAYELRIEEYELRMPTYLRRTCDVPFVSRYAVDTRVDTRMCDSPIYFSFFYSNNMNQVLCCLKIQEKV